MATAVDFSTLNALMTPPAWHMASFQPSCLRARWGLHVWTRELRSKIRFSDLWGFENVSAVSEDLSPGCLRGNTISRWRLAWGITVRTCADRHAHGSDATSLDLEVVRMPDPENGRRATDICVGRSSRACRFRRRAGSRPLITHIPFYALVITRFGFCLLAQQYDLVSVEQVPLTNNKAGWTLAWD